MALYNAGPVMQGISIGSGTVVKADAKTTCGDNKMNRNCRISVMILSQKQPKEDEEYNIGENL